MWCASGRCLFCWHFVVFFFVFSFLFSHAAFIIHGCLLSLWMSGMCFRSDEFTQVKSAPVAMRIYYTHMYSSNKLEIHSWKLQAAVKCVCLCAFKCGCEFINGLKYNEWKSVFIYAIHIRCIWRMRIKSWQRKYEYVRLYLFAVPFGLYINFFSFFFCFDFLS